MNENLQIRASKFIEKSIKVHGSKYDYSKVDYLGNHKNVCIICPEHGEFNQTPGNHSSGKGCLQCARKRVSQKLFYATEKFIEKAIISIISLFHISYHLVFIREQNSL